MDEIGAVWRWREASVWYEMVSEDEGSGRVTFVRRAVRSCEPLATRWEFSSKFWMREKDIVGASCRGIVLRSFWE